MKLVHRGTLVSLFLFAFLLIAVFVGTTDSLALNEVASDTLVETVKAKPAPHWTSVVPPLVAIFIALVFRQVIFALFISLWIGAWLLSDSGINAVFSSFFATLTDYIVPALADPDHIAIVLFSLLIGGMIGIITENGGTRGIIEVMTRFIKTRRQGQLSTVFLGFLVFFDDYANTMIVGNTMRPITDKLKISRAKLAYLVDSTAAPVATVALVSTWIGAMVAYIADAEANMPNYHEAAYLVFVNSLPYNFYAFFTIFFVFLVAYTGKDFGPMLHARIKMLKGKDQPELDVYNLWKDKIEEESSVDTPKEPVSHYLNAALPILTLVFTTITGLWISGEGNTIQDIIATANSYSALMWGALLSISVAVALTVGQRLLHVEQMIKGMMNGMHTMFDGLIILVFAWALSHLTKELQTADFLVSVFNEKLNPFWLPVIIFILSGLTSFSTGSSWGTMGILMPLVVPLMWALGNQSGLEFVVIHELIYASVASVLAGSVWGDHCSPISDTTILSSLASQCDHVEHVNTQLPYAMIVGVVSIVALILVSVLDLSPWIIYPIGFGGLYAFFWKFGKYAHETDELSHELQQIDKSTLH